MKEQFIDIYKAHIQREGADAFLEWLEKTDFFKAPAWWSIAYTSTSGSGSCM